MRGHSTKQKPPLGAPGVLYVSTPIIFNPDRAKVLEPNVNGTINILKAAARTKVQRFVLNSSSKSVEKTVYNQPHELTTETFNYEALQKARYEPASPTFERTLDVYSAGRTAAELAFWSWIKDKKPPFVANCVVPDGNFGRGEQFSELFPSLFDTFQSTNFRARTFLLGIRGCLEASEI